jgi:hypothetical protein
VRGKGCQPNDRRTDAVSARTRASARGQVDTGQSETSSAGAMSDLHPLRALRRTEGAREPFIEVARLTGGGPQAFSRGCFGTRARGQGQTARSTAETAAKRKEHDGLRSSALLPGNCRGPQTGTSADDPTRRHASACRGGGHRLQASPEGRAEPSQGARTPVRTRPLNQDSGPGAADEGSAQVIHDRRGEPRELRRGASAP